MTMQRERVVAPTVVVTEAAVCFDAAAGWFVVRCRVRACTAEGLWQSGIVTSPLSRRQLDAEAGGPELAEYLIAHPGVWWRLPVSQRVEEGYGL